MKNIPLKWSNWSANKNVDIFIADFDQLLCGTCVKMVVNEIGFNILQWFFILHFNSPEYGDSFRIDFHLQHRLKFQRIEHTNAPYYCR